VARRRPPPQAGLARERTELAWNRSGLAALVCIAVLLRRLWPLHGAGEVVALAGIASGAAVWVLALALGRIGAGGYQDRSVKGVHAFALMSAATVILAVAAFVLGLFPP